MSQTIMIPIEMPAMEGEVWKIVDGYSLYVVSNKGRVYSIKHEALMTPQKSSKHTEHRKILLHKCGEVKGFYVHRLVAMAFIPNPLKKVYINHIDANPQNNCVENLEWATPKENTQHSYRMGLQIMPTNRAIGEARSKKLKTVDVIEIKNLLINRTLSYAEIGRKFNVIGQTIRCIETGASWSHLNIPSLISAGIALNKTL